MMQAAKFLSWVLVLVVFLSLAAQVQAATPSSRPHSPFPTPKTATISTQPAINLGSVNQLPSFTLSQAVTFIIRLLIIAAFLLAFIFLLIGGIRWILSGGDVKALESARNTVTAALVGLVIVLAAFALIRLIEFFFRITIISAPLSIPQI